MKTSPKGRKLIERYEGLILGAYDDLRGDRIVQPGERVAGTLTIGYGHTTAAGSPKVFIGQRITREQADQILASDLVKVERDVERLVKVPLTQNQFDALVSFHFNTGALGKSSALKLLNQKKYKEAADALTLYNKSKGATLQGLVRRRNEERKLFLTPDSQPVHENNAAGAVIVAGGIAAGSASHTNYWPWILGATLIVGISTWVLIRYLRKKKETKNVQK